MKKADLAYIVSVVFLSVTALSYCATIWLPIKLPRYYPLAHVWKWAKEPGVPSQGWYGMQVFAFLVGGAAAGLVYLALQSRRPQETSLKPAVMQGLAWITMLVLAFSLAFLLHHEFAKWGVYTTLWK